MPRIRLSSIEPAELTDDIINLVGSPGPFCHHFHIPLQSGDDGVLKRMGRHYTRSFFADLVYKVRSRITDAAIGVDVLVGFPGESDTAFKNTFDLIESIPVTYLHVFPFSPRKTTPAFDMPDKVPPAVIKERAARIRALGERKRRAFYELLVGKEVEVLVETAYDDANGICRGRTSNYVPVRIRNCPGNKNRFVTVMVEEVEGGNVLASPISSPAAS